MSVDKNRLDNTIKIVADVLEENKNNPKIIEEYEAIKRLKEKRSID